MTVTLSVQEMLISLLLIVGIVAIIILVKVFLKLSTTLEKTNDLLDDVKSMTTFASAQTEKIGGIIVGIEDTVGTVSENMSANRGMIKNAASLVGAATTIAGVVRKAGDKDAMAAKVTKNKSEKETSDKKSKK